MFGDIMRKFDFFCVCCLIVSSVLTGIKFMPFVNGRSYPWTDTSLRSVFMLNSSNVWAVGQNGGILRCDGVAWKTVASPTDSWLQSVYMNNETDGWAVGSDGAIIRWNGTFWGTVPSPIAENLYEMSMVNPDDGWAVGWDGNTIHWNGTGWSTVSSPTTKLLFSVYMADSSNVWAVGSSGTIIRWNGTAWNSVSSSITGWFFSVFMIDENEGWAVGDFGSIIHWNGSEWVQSVTSIYQGDLIISGDDVFIIEDERFDINGSIIVEENATLILKNSLLNFVQTTNNQFNLTLRNPADGYPCLVAYNSTIDSNADLRLIFKGNSTVDLNSVTIPWRVACFAYDDSILLISNSSYINTLFAESGSSAHIVVRNSTIHEWHNYGYITAPEAQVSDSFIDNLLIGSSSINCTISGLRPGLVTRWNFIENCSVVSTGGPGGAAPNVTLTNTKVYGWRFGFYSSSHVTIIDSVVNAYAYGETSIRIFWYLDVHIVDDINQDVPSANVTVQSGTLMESKFTDEDGWARLTLMEKTKNATGEYPVGTYTVEANYETYSNSTTIEMTGPQQITLTLDGFIIPEFPSFLIIPLFMIATLLAVMMYRKNSKVHEI
jgi:hypothetical protein